MLPPEATCQIRPPETAEHINLSCSLFPFLPIIRNYMQSVLKGNTDNVIIVRPRAIITYVFSTLYDARTPHFLKNDELSKLLQPPLLFEKLKQPFFPSQNAFAHRPMHE